MAQAVNRLLDNPAARAAARQRHPPARPTPILAPRRQTIADLVRLHAPTRTAIRRPAHHTNAGYRSDVTAAVSPAERSAWTNNRRPVTAERSGHGRNIATFGGVRYTTSQVPGG
jgi:hypothetical protein